MANNDVEVAIIGGGAAGVAAGRRLHDAGIGCLIAEPRAGVDNASGGLCARPRRRLAAFGGSQSVDEDCRSPTLYYRQDAAALEPLVARL
jgi:2-polyprenyl-6-methoxyphenol hydroxylase-like FAD-dependent oxidoreductase